MKYRMISDEDVAAIRAARKSLNRIARKAARLNAAEKAALGNPKMDYKKIALENWRMLDELENLGISDLNSSRLSIRIVPSDKRFRGYNL